MTTPNNLTREQRDESGNFMKPVDKTLVERLRNHIAYPTMSRYGSDVLLKECLTAFEGLLALEQWNTRESDVAVVRELAGDTTLKPRPPLGSLVPLLCILCLFLTGCASVPVKPVAKPSPPPTPMEVAERIEAVRSSLFAMSVVAPPPAKSNALVSLAWTKAPDAAVMSYRIYSTNGLLMATADAAYNNVVIRGLREGVRYSFYATAMNDVGTESDQSNIAFAIASNTPPWTVPYQAAYAWTFTWKSANGITNILLSSTDLKTWTPRTSFRGTNGVASVLLTNSVPRDQEFFRALYQNATNQTPPTLAQNVSFITLAWPDKGTATVLERLADARSESYLAVDTNRAGITSTVQPFSNEKYRLVTQ